MVFDFKFRVPNFRFRVFGRTLGAGPLGVGPLGAGPIWGRPTWGRPIGGQKLITIDEDNSQWTAIQTTKSRCHQWSQANATAIFGAPSVQTCQWDHSSQIQKVNPLRNTQTKSSVSSEMQTALANLTSQAKPATSSPPRKDSFEVRLTAINGLQQIEEVFVHNSLIFVVFCQGARESQGFEEYEESTEVPNHQRIGAFQGGCS